MIIHVHYRKISFYGDVNSGSWHKKAIAKECTDPKHILMQFCHFIDGLALDKYGNIIVEAVLTYCLWFNRKTRNRFSTWWVQGFVEDQTLFSDQKFMPKLIVYKTIMKCYHVSFKRCITYINLVVSD